MAPRPHCAAGTRRPLHRALLAIGLLRVPGAGGEQMIDVQLLVAELGGGAVEVESARLVAATTSFHPYSEAGIHLVGCACPGSHMELNTDVPVPADYDAGKPVGPAEHCVRGGPGTMAARCELRCRH